MTSLMTAITTFSKLATDERFTFRVSKLFASSSDMLSRTYVKTGQRTMREVAADGSLGEETKLNTITHAVTRMAD